MFSNSIRVMSMVMRLPNSCEILISHFPVLSLAQESGNAQAHYNMVSLLGRDLFGVGFCFKGLLFCFLLQHPANEEHTHDNDVKNANRYPHDESAQLLICGCRDAPYTWRGDIRSIKWRTECQTCSK